MECTFAINSTAPGFVLIQDEYPISRSLQRNEGDDRKGSVNITDLPAGKYNVTVFDEMKDSFTKEKIAYQYPDTVHISGL